MFRYLRCKDNENRVQNKIKVFIFYAEVHLILCKDTTFSHFHEGNNLRFSSHYIFFAKSLVHTDYLPIFAPFLNIIELNKYIYET